MTYLRTGVLAVGTVLGTMLAGWWFVVVVGIAGGLLAGSGRTSVIEVSLGAALGWAAMLAGSAVTGPVWTVAERVGPVFGLPAAGFAVITLVFPALLAGSAALVVKALRPGSPASKG